MGRKDLKMLHPRQSDQNECAPCPSPPLLCLAHTRALAPTVAPPLAPHCRRANSWKNWRRCSVSLAVDPHCISSWADTTHLW